MYEVNIQVTNREASSIRKHYALQSPLAFGLTYLPHHLTNSVPDFHKEILAHINDPLVAIAAPREHAKSTLVDVVLTLYELVKELFHYQLYVGDTASVAAANLATLVNELENNQALIEDFGNLKPADPEKWTDHTIITTTGIKIEAVGVGMKVRGRKHNQYRPDRIICDDIENDEHVSTKEQRQKLKRWFFSALLNAREHENAKVRVIGTILHHDSHLSHLLNPKENELWTKLRYKAVNIIGDQPTPLWPGRWNLAALAEKKAEVGSVIFEQEYQNNPVSEEDAIIKRQWIKQHNGYTPEQVTEWDKVLYVDPAAKAKETSDEFALCVVGKNSENRMAVLDRWHGKLTFKQQAATIGRIAQRWIPGGKLQVIVETVAYQEALRQEVEDWSRETGIYLPIKGSNTSKDKTLRLVAQSGVIEGGYITFGPEDQDLIDQLTDWGKTRYDDLADAFLGAVEHLRTSNPAYIEFLKNEAKATAADPVQSFMATYGNQLTRQ